MILNNVVRLARRICDNKTSNGRKMKKKKRIYDFVDLDIVFDKLEKRCLKF